MDLEKATVVTTFQNRESAEAAASLLRSEDVEVIISFDDAGGGLPNLDLGKSIRLLVQPENVAFARGVLGLDATTPVPSL